MLHPEDLDALRKMTPIERLRLGMDLTNFGWQFLERLPAKERQRRLDLARKPWNLPPAPLEE